MDIIENIVCPLLIIFLFFFFLVCIEIDSKEEIEIIKKEKNVYIYEHCNTINDKYYCWDEIKKED